MVYQSDDSELRRVERDVLDPFHTTLDLYKRGRDEARLGLLAAYDCLALPEAMTMMMGREPHVGTRQLQKHFEDGLSQSMRWLTQPGEEPSVSARLVTGLLNDAGNFLIHAADYSNLADLHRLYSAKQMLAEVDQQSKRIRFKYSSEDKGFEAGMGFITSMDHELVKLRGDNVKKAKIQPQKRIGHNLLNGMVRLQSPELLAANDPAFALPIPPKIIADDAALDGFSMSEFRAFWKAIVHWSTHCLVIYVKLAMSGKDQELCMPTQVIPVGQFHDVIEKLSSLSREHVERITERLAFDYRTKTPCIFQQPLLVGGGNVAWSPYLILYSRYDRNMLRLMTRTPAQKRTADNLIGGRERPMLNSFGKRLQNSGWSYKLNQQIHQGGRHGELDLLGYTQNQPDTVMVVEWKSILTVDEVQEVRAATAELMRAQVQAIDRVEILRAMSSHEKHKLYPFVPWGAITEYVPLVATLDVEPDEMYDHAKVPCLCIDSLITFGRGRDLRSPARLAEFSRSRLWHKKYAHLRQTFREIGIGGFIYEIPMLVDEKNEIKGVMTT